MVCVICCENSYISEVLVFNDESVEKVKTMEHLEFTPGAFILKILTTYVLQLLIVKCQNLPRS
jgi:hypothetical protein